jgi:hypothetical protein
MKEIYDLRINNDYANEVVGPNEGKKTAIVRIVKMTGTDPRLAIIERRFRELKRQGEYLFFGWDIDRQYNEQEIEQVESFLLKITSVFEPEGEDGGTKYDDAGACPLCKAGAPQLTPLYLPERRIPKSKDISRTIAGEIVISRKLKELFVRHRISGVQLIPVRYSVKSSAESPDWFQLVLTESTVEVAPHNWVGLGLFQEDVKGEYRWFELGFRNLCPTYIYEAN